MLLFSFFCSEAVKLLLGGTVLFCKERYRTMFFSQRGTVRKDVRRSLSPLSETEYPLDVGLKAPFIFIHVLRFRLCGEVFLLL